MSTPRSITLPQGVQRVAHGPTGLATLQLAGTGIGTVLLAPGFTGSKEDFLDLFGSLGAAGWTVVAVDHRGQFQSPPRPDSAAYDLDLWAEDLCDLAETLPQPVHLVGHSLGGLIAGAAASRRPWASVTLLNSGSGPIHESQHERLRILIASLEAASLDQIWQLRAQMEAARGQTASPPEIELFMRERFTSGDPECLAAMAQILLAGPEQDLDDVDCPVMLAFGIDDPDSWSWQTQVDLARRWRSRLALIPGAAHSPAVEAPEVTAALLMGFFSASHDQRCVVPPANGYAVDMQLLAHLSADTSAIRDARRIVGDHLHGWGMADRAEDAELVTSELVTNAIRHGHNPMELHLSTKVDRIRITVVDSNVEEVPQRVSSQGLDEGGRGLLIIENLCLAWGHDRTENGKLVWAELSHAIA